jgi:hypothetical protein
MVSLLRWIIAKLSSHWDMVTWVVGWLWTLGGGAMTGWAARASGILSQWAPLSWVIAGIGGAAVCAVVWWVITKAQYALAQAKWIRTWSSPGDGVNPMDDSFTRKRIKINDFVSPVHKVIDGKVFDRCELIGPTLVLLQDVNLHSPLMIDCNFICCKDNVQVTNVVVLKNVNLINCKLYGFTFLVPETATDGFTAIGVKWLARTPKEFNAPVPWPSVGFDRSNQQAIGNDVKI